MTLCCAATQARGTVQYITIENYCVIHLASCDVTGKIKWQIKFAGIPHKSKLKVNILIYK